ncbi:MULTISPECIES: HD domain-containing protein [Amycolatopsis]|uniref:HD domain-containing protein n=1 Tax=Amycolatopsis thermalba TaxID=944492 RepID=A0ABY4P3T9_9PSEU|nr:MULTISPECIES: HD domain-containing protein [Amycolatopsis]OXM72993.1 phosphohydrolase [Amycolatopsis sp. KNN50.9b]UQS26873.1 HD domain-containing protein [Amycolatopsis thermalba]
MSLISWAYDLSEAKLRDALPRRWAHVQGVARQARTLASIAGSDAELLEAAAVLHDIGYAPDLVDTGFHPIDGATYLAKVDAPERLVHLVAHHSYAVYEAELRGLTDELADFHDERGSIRDALWYCDLTTSPDGETVDAEDRIAEIKRRYGPDHLVTRFITGATPELLAAVERTKGRLSAVSAANPNGRPAGS